jgi:2-polyprenyl-3-methyl-5-hydroxy-6-metoxy-1,4-benzoquinol methylase
MFGMEHQTKLKEILNSAHFNFESNNISLKKLFFDVSDDFWFWLFTDGYASDPRLKKILPTMPDKRIQQNFTGRSGKDAFSEAFSAYILFKQITEKHAKKISDQNAVLDFGCGWGRIIRFFLKDLEPSQIYGADCYKEMIDICNNSNLNCNFDTIDPMPPIKYQDNMFDVIYLYSVFSHLSEEAHLVWLKEFHRILKPGGIFLATTRPVEFIEHCKNLAKMKKINEWELGSTIAFSEPEQAYRDYNEGKFVHSSTGGGGVLDKSFFGESCISESYVRNNWNKFFSELEYIPFKKHTQFDQNMIVGIK